MGAAKLKLAVFDCDGTIVDSQHSHLHSMRAAFERYDLVAPPREVIRRVIGLPLVHSFAILAPDQTPDRHEDLRQAYSDDWQELRAQGNLSEPLYPGFKEALDCLVADGWLLGVATGKSHRGLLATLEKHDLSNRFVTLQTADRARGKPHPEMLIKAMEEAGVSAPDTVMIGDTTFDIEMSINAGVRAICVAWGYHDPGELMACGADLVLDDYSQLQPSLSH